jgi:hypothetical protein
MAEVKKRKADASPTVAARFLLAVPSPEEAEAERLRDYLQMVVALCNTQLVMVECNGRSVVDGVLHVTIPAWDKSVSDETYKAALGITDGTPIKLSTKTCISNGVITLKRV